MARYHYYVQPSGLRWQLTDGLGQKHYYNTQAEAITIARQSAHRDFNQGHNAQVHVAGVNGRFRTEWTYGDDPAKYPG